MDPRPPAQQTVALSTELNQNLEVPAFGNYAKNAKEINHKELWHNGMIIRVLKRKPGKVTSEINVKTILVESHSLSS